jgi:hypothetical protein
VIAGSRLLPVIVQAAPKWHGSVLHYKENVSFRLGITAIERHGIADSFPDVAVRSTAHNTLAISAESLINLRGVWFENAGGDPPQPLPMRMLKIRPHGTGRKKRRCHSPNGNE